MQLSPQAQTVLSDHPLSHKTLAYMLAEALPSHATIEGGKNSLYGIMVVVVFSYTAKVFFSKVKNTQHLFLSV